MRRLLWYIPAFLGASLVLAAALLALALGTETGSRQLIERGMSLVPGELTGQLRQGTLLRGVELTKLRYRNDDLQVELESLEVALNLPALFQGTLGLRHLQARGLDVHLPETEAPAPVDDALPTLPELPDIHVPLRISVSESEIRDIRIYRPGAATMALDRLALQGSLGSDRLQLQRLYLEQGDNQLELAGELGLTMPWRADLQLDWALPLPEQAAQWLGESRPRGQGEARLRGNLEKLDLEHVLHEPRTIHSRGTARPMAEPASVDMHHQWESLTLLLPEQRRASLGPGQLHTRGHPAAWHLELRATELRIADHPALAVHAAAKGDLEQLQLLHAELDSDQGQLSASGNLAWKEALRWQARVQARELDPAWLEREVALSPQVRQHLERIGALSLDASLQGSDKQLTLDSATLSARPGSVTLQGDLAWQQTLQWDLSASGELDPGPWLRELAPESGEESGLVALSLQAAGTDRELMLEEASLSSGHGSLDLSGELGWAPRIHWDLAVRGRELNPALVHREFPGAVNLDGHLAGELPETAPELTVQLSRLDGLLREQPLLGQGRVRMTGLDQVDTDFVLSLADIEFSARGHWGDRPDLLVTLDAPRLDQLLPELGGKADSELRLSGTRENPLLAGHLRLRELRWQDLQLATADLSVNASERPEPTMTLALETGRLRRGETLLINTSSLQATGTLSAHTLQWELTRDKEQLRGGLRGGLAAQGDWQGELEKLRVSGPLSGTWEQEAPAAVQAGRERALLAPLCLAKTDRQGRLCGQADWRPESLQADLELGGVPLAPLAALIPRPAELQGTINGRAFIRHREGSLEGELELDAGEGRVILHALDDDSGYQLPWQTLQAGATLRDNRLETSARIIMDEHSRARGELSAELDGLDSPLDGRLEASLEDLRWLELLAPRIRQTRGSIQGLLTVGGTFVDPRFGGEMSLENGGAEIPEIGVALREVNVHARAGLDGVLLVRGGMVSGEDGQLRIDGELDTGGDLPWPLSLHITGTDFEAVHRPDARALLNPDLRIVLQGTSVRVRGEVLIPRARLSPREIPQQASRLSRDVVLVTETPETVTSPWEVDTDVRITLGDQVSIQGFGLNSRLAGTVRIQDPPGRTPHLTGEINLEEGRYRAWGQNLQIERGRLLFEGPPDNPGLDILAVRVIPAHQVRVGLEVSGTLQNPRSRVVSTPPMEETEAMSFLLTGRPLSGANEGDASMIIQAIARFGIERGDFITERLGETLGVEVDVDTEGEFDETSLMLGKQLSSQLYLRYSVGLFESVSTVMLRYQLSPRVSLETRSSGEAQSVDLIYRRER